ncbi:hypothetical protein [Pimelobacter simplex]|uniref:hypothetical protein n=1 Tax=Nocardioides simplex TaxID=2045 RepID=UPI003AAED859
MTTTQPTPSTPSTPTVLFVCVHNACPYFPGKRYDDWKLDDPAGQGIDAVRAIRDDIKARVAALVAELLPNA